MGENAGGLYTRVVPPIALARDRTTVWAQVHARFRNRLSQVISMQSIDCPCHNPLRQCPQTSTSLLHADVHSIHGCVLALRFLEAQCEIVYILPQSGLGCENVESTENSEDNSRAGPGPCMHNSP